MRLAITTGSTTVRGKEAPMSQSASPKPQLAVQIRWMIRRDMPDVLRIERESFEFDWTEEDFLNCLRQRNCIGMVAEHDGRVVGFMVYCLHKTRLQLLNFAVASSHRHFGIGRQLVDKLVNKLSQQRRQEISVELRETNLAASCSSKREDSARSGSRVRTSTTPGKTRSCSRTGWTATIATCH